MEENRKSYKKEYPEEPEIDVRYIPTCPIGKRIFRSFKQQNYEI